MRPGDSLLHRCRIGAAFVLSALVLSVTPLEVLAAYELALVANGLAQPVFVTHAGDGSGRLFVVEQGGTIQVVQNGSVLDQPFLDISSLVTTSGNEQGLLGLAFHPDYEVNGRFFVFYTAKGDGDLTIARYRVSEDPDQADSKGKIILSIPHPTNTNHNGGMLAFGPDGYLYSSTGDGGGTGDSRNNAQNKRSLLGKILRINVDKGKRYKVPQDNPFVGHGRTRPEIWAYGLRNPWRFSFDRSTGQLYIGDVGQLRYEEINVAPADDPGGRNYGWRIREGQHCYPSGDSCSAAGLVDPIVEYEQASGRCAVTGGYVYRGTSASSLMGRYIYADFCSGEIWSAQDGQKGWQSTQVLDSSYFISSFGEDEAGELYIVHRGGAIYRLTEGS